MGHDKARILLWGISGSGKTTTLQMIHSKLQADLRGELTQEPTRLDPTVFYESMPIMLGKVGGLDSQIELLAVPGAADQAMTRKQLLDEVDGIVLVLDCSPARIEENWAALTELRESLGAYGRALEEIPVVLQYNKRDVADPFAIEALHRRIELDQAAVFETIATTGHGVMATLTTISKHVVRARKNQTSRSGIEPVSTLDATPSREDPNATSHEILEAAILAEADGALDAEVTDGVELNLGSVSQPDWKDEATAGAAPKPAHGELRIVSAGTAVVDAEGGLRLPVVLGDERGETRSMVLSIRLDALLTGGGD